LIITVGQSPKLSDAIRRNTTPPKTTKRATSSTKKNTATANIPFDLAQGEETNKTRT
jgi:hypothetical protein